MQAAGKKTKWPVSSIKEGPRASVVGCRRRAGPGSKRSNPFSPNTRKLLSKAKAAIGSGVPRVPQRGAHHEDTLNYFGSLTINIVEVYGMSENTGPQTCGQPEHFQAGTCGTLPAWRSRSTTIPPATSLARVRTCFPAATS